MAARRRPRARTRRFAREARALRVDPGPVPTCVQGHDPRGRRMQRIGRGRRARGTCKLSRDELTVQSEWYKARTRLALGYGLAGASRRKANPADQQRCALQRSRHSRSNQAARSCAPWPRSRQRKRTPPQACGACSSGSRGAGAAGLVRALRTCRHTHRRYRHPALRWAVIGPIVTTACPPRRLPHIFTVVGLFDSAQPHAQARLA